MRRAAFVLLVLGLGLVAGCRTRQTHVNECAAILDRLVTLELEHRGFHDPALAARARDALHHDLLPELERCHDRPWDAAHAACVQHATTIDQLRRDCLGRRGTPGGKAP